MPEHVDPPDDAALAALRAAVPMQALMEAHQLASEGLVLVERERIIDANPSFCRLIGYPRDELLALTSYAPLTDAAAATRLRERWQRWTRGEETAHAFPITLRHKDGRAVPVELIVLPFAAVKGGRFIVLVRPVTGQHDGQSIVNGRISPDQLEAILHGVADGITVQEPDGALIYANAAAARILGYPSAAALINVSGAAVLRHFIMLDDAGRPFPPERLPGRRALRGERDASATIRFRILASGEEHWAIVSANPVVDAAGQVRFAINVFTDITERTRSELAQRFLADASRQLAASLDYETTLQQVAALAVPQLADWCAVDLLEGGAIRTVAVAHVDPAKVALAHELQRRYPVQVDEPTGVPRVLRDGAAVVAPSISEEQLAAGARDAEHLAALRQVGFVSVMIVPLQARERTIGALTFVWAESGRHYGEQDLLLAQNLADRCAQAVDNAQLYREAQAQTARAERANAELRATAAARDQALADLQAAVHTRDEFMGTISHDLKNPLTAIKGIAQSLRRHINRAPAPDPARLVDGLTTIDTSVTELTTLLDELLDLVRLQSGAALRLDPAPTDLVALAQRAAQERQQATEQHRIVVAAAEPAISGEWDATRIARALDNLLSNAVKYSPAGGQVTLRLHREAREGRPHAVLSVVDEGVGIPAADLPHIFERYRRGSNVAAAFSGTGIGLAGAKQIVEQHGGTITVQSEEGAGSTFTITLPLPSDASAGD